jgi:predicted GNAT family N-acyltransferase
VSLLHDDDRPRRGRALADLAVRVGDWARLGADARVVRLKVFVEEQGIAPELELDERDATAVHAVAFDAAGQPVATGRLLPDAHIGRMAVLADVRGQGVGAAILRALTAMAATRGDREVRLHAQRSAIGFYLREGFIAEGEEYMEAGIPHQTMARRLHAEPA